MILRADWVLPIASDPIKYGEIVIHNGAIVDVRRRSGTRGGAEVLDFGEAIILPGLVDVHAHLELTALRGAIEDLPFHEWLLKLVKLKALLSEQDWRDSALWGAMEAVGSGITTLADTTDSGASAYALLQVGLRGRVYQEVFAVEPAISASSIVRGLEEKLLWLHRAARGTAVEIGVAPHALYTIRPSALVALREFTQQHRYPVCIHAAESEEELSLLQDGSGKFAQMYNDRDIPWEPSGEHPLDTLHKGGWLGADTLLVHCVHTGSAHAQLLAITNTAVAHCPQSNAKLYNGIAPLTHWLAEGVRVGLGTDSVVSNNTLDMFAEMRASVMLQRAKHQSDSCMTARRAVELATMGGAQALGMEQRVGTLEPGKQADLCVVSLRGLHHVPLHDPYAALVFGARACDVQMTMVAGRIVYRQGEFPTLREQLPALRQRIQRLAQRIRDFTRTDER